MLGGEETTWALQKVASQLISNVCCDCRSSGIDRRAATVCTGETAFICYKGVPTCLWGSLLPLCMQPALVCVFSLLPAIGSRSLYPGKAQSSGGAPGPWSLPPVHNSEQLSR